MENTSKILLGFAKTVFIFACIIGGFALGFQWVGYRQTFSADNDRFSAVFPVAVVYFDSALGKNVVEVVEQGNLAATTNAHPGFTYLVPAGQEKELNDYTDLHDRGLQNPVDFSGYTPWSTGFEVEMYSAGEQRIRAWRDVSEDYSNIGWYVATKDGIKPERHKYLGPGAGFLAFPFGLIGGIVGAVLLKIAKRIYRKRHQVSSEQNINIENVQNMSWGLMPWGLFAVLISCILATPKSYIMGIIDPTFYGTHGWEFSYAISAAFITLLWSPIYFAAGCGGAYFIQKFFKDTKIRIGVFIIFIALIKAIFI